MAIKNNKIKNSGSILRCDFKRERLTNTNDVEESYRT